LVIKRRPLTTSKTVFETDPAAFIRKVAGNQHFRGLTGGVRTAVRRKHRQITGIVQIVNQYLMQLGSQSGILIIGKIRDRDNDFTGFL
jgi:hypothetical protein